MPGWIGVPELLILLLVVLLVFGPKKLPEMGRSLGKGMREFKTSVTGKEDVPAQLTTAPAVEEPVRAPASTSKRELDSI
jgi:sec-independent protein translocase protein TatA